LAVWAVVPGKRAGRGVLKLLKRPARFGRGLVPERGMRPERVSVAAPERQLPAGVLQSIEDLLIQKRVAQVAWTCRGIVPLL